MYPLKNLQMDTIKSRELDILITISQNKKVPTEKFNQLFENKWSLYVSRFDDLKPEGLFRVSVQNPELTTYELTNKGNSRMMDLLNIRTEEIQIRLIQLQNSRRELTVPGWKIYLGILNLLKGTAYNSRNTPIAHSKSN